MYPTLSADVMDDLIDAYDSWDAYEDSFDAYEENIDAAAHPIVRTIANHERLWLRHPLSDREIGQILRGERPNYIGIWVTGGINEALATARRLGFSTSLRDQRAGRRNGNPYVVFRGSLIPIYYGNTQPFPLLGRDIFARGDGDFDAFEDAMVDALEAEDTDEFFRRLVRGIGRVARGIGRGIGRVARVVAPIASAIPLPWTQAIGRIANVAGRLLADGADEFEAIDALVDLAETEDLFDAAAPAIATMALHGVMPQTARLPQATRQQLVQATTQTAQTLARQQGTQAVRALPAIVQTAQRAAQQQGQPPRALPGLIRRLGMRFSQNPQLLRRLLQSASPGLRQSICATCASTGMGSSSSSSPRRRPAMC
jgi:hypothetical protein